VTRRPDEDEEEDDDEDWGEDDVAPGDDEPVGPFERASDADRDLLHALHAALRVTRLHALDNVVAVEAVQDLASRLADCLAAEEHVTVVAGERRLFVNRGAVPIRRHGYSWEEDFMESLARGGLGGLILSGEWGEGACRTLLAAMNQPGEQAGERARAAVAYLGEHLVPPAEGRLITPTQAQSLMEEAGDERLPAVERANLYYARLLALAEQVGRLAAAGSDPDEVSRPLRQTLIRLIDRLGPDEPVFTTRLLGLTYLPAPSRDPWAVHAACVTVLALVMGRLLGLKRGELGDLGFAAFFHDAGRWITGREAATGANGGEHRRTTGGHVLSGLGALLRGRVGGEGGLYRLVVAQEVHRVVDGYPDSPELGAPHPLTWLVGAADAFARLEAGTPWEPPVGPAAALRRLREAGHDPAVVALLADALGRYPRGTLLRLYSGEVAVVVDGGPRRGDLPIGRRLVFADGEPDPGRELLELQLADVEELGPQELDPGWRWQEAAVL